MNPKIFLPQLSILVCQKQKISKKLAVIRPLECAI